MDNQINQVPEGRSHALLPWIAAGVVLGLAAANGFLFWRSSKLEAELRLVRESMQIEIDSLRAGNASAVAAARRSLDELNQRLQDTSTKAGFAAVRAKTDAEKHAEKLVRTLADQQKQQQEAIETEIGAVKQATEASLLKVGEVATEVGSVKGEVASARSALEQTIAELKSVRGDLGVQSGLIATNAQELAALKQLGERNYFEFNIARKNQPSKIGGIVMTLKRTDTKRNKYNLEIIADDKRVEKKDKTINEPVQFYVSGTRLPLEIVVNEVHKDRIVGYLASPKMVHARR